jgi:hypothetical protein
LIELSLRLFTGSTLQAESLAMLSKALPFLRQVLRWDVTQAVE